MIYQVIYKNAAGQPLLEATFNADGPAEAMKILASTPSLEPPAGTEDIDIRRVES